MKFGYLDELVKEEANYLEANSRVEKRHHHLTMVRTVDHMERSQNHLKKEPSACGPYF